MSDDIRERRARSVVIGLLLLIAAMILLDLLTDYQEGVEWRHLVIELAVLMFAATGIVLLLRQFGVARAELSEAREEATHWRQQNQEIIRGLGTAIEIQFERWGLTAAEAQVGLMLLKGYSHKEVAALRQTSERTVREQARAIYRKAGLSGRASLSAFFLEDLLLPRGASNDEDPA
jgi:DNA-binding CsgD family transcriptional regulator